MIKLFWIVLFITAIAKAQVIQNDKLLHMSGSYVISSTVASLVYNKTKNKKCSLLSGFAVSMFIGAGKEIYDRKHGNPDWNDMLANTIGSTLGIVTIKIAL